MTQQSSDRSVTVEETHVIVHERFRRWDSISPVERATPDDLERIHAHYPGADLVRDLEILENPKCLVAIRRLNMRGKYVPCVRPTLAGAELCNTHGGPTARTTPMPNPPRPSRLELEAEVERLRARLAATS